jgi:hypothetical protein
LAKEKTVNRSWPIDVDELKAFEADAATGDRAKTKSNMGAGSHHFLLNNESA